MLDLSIVIPTYNRLERLKQVLTALEHQQAMPASTEVLVISDGSSDGTHEYLAALRPSYTLRYIVQENSGPAAARNRGIAEARGEILLFIDDDVVPSPHLVEEHMRLHQQQANTVVLGPMLTPSDFTLKPWVVWEQVMLEKQYQAMEQGEWEPSPRQFYTGNTSLERKHLVAVGGFDERFRRAEDIELAYRLAAFDLRFTFNARAIGYHYAERSFQSWLAIPYAYGRNDVIFSRERAEWILPLVRIEFKRRHFLIRTLVQLCLDRPRLSQAVQTLLTYIALHLYRPGITRVSRFAYSAIFNLRFYQGVVDEIGGKKHFLV